jgi:hypothetical protein
MAGLAAFCHRFFPIAAPSTAGSATRARAGMMRGRLISEADPLVPFRRGLVKTRQRFQKHQSR